MTDFSRRLLAHRDAQNTSALERISIALRRVPDVLERETVAHQKTLEQKISDQGPTHLRVHPHLLTIALQELSAERGSIRIYTHEATGKAKWYANSRTDPDAVHQKLAELAPLYASVSSGAFPNFVGDALEVVVFKTLQELHATNPRYSFQGAFDLDGPRTSDGRYKKSEPPNVISGHRSEMLPDFILYGFDTGPISIECKNYREWIYPRHGIISKTIQKCLETRTTPLLIARRIHYTTIRNFLAPAGIIAHETYYQYYPADQLDLAQRVKHKRSLGFSDIRATEVPEPRTSKFFQKDLPRIAASAARRFQDNAEALWDYIADEINLAQLYNAIGSPAAGKWVDQEDKVTLRNCSD